MRIVFAPLMLTVTMMTHVSRRLSAGRIALASFGIAGALLFHTPVSAQPCDGGTFSPTTGNLVGSALGGATGGLIGNQFGKGAGKGVATGVGAVGGALAGGYVGRQIECNNAQQQQQRAVQPQTTTGTAIAPRRAAAASPGRAPTDTRTCRFVTTQAVIDGREQQVEGIACLEGDGSWRTAAGPAAQRAAEADLVLRTQQRLRDEGFYVRDNIDGVWGPATSGAVRNFQRANGLASTGQLDGATRTALGIDAAPLTTAVSSRGSESAAGGIAQRPQ
jgi:surface antigen